jgi:hypothetical protein
VLIDNSHFIESPALYLVSASILFSIWLHVSFIKFNISFTVDFCSVYTFNVSSNESSGAVDLHHANINTINAENENIQNFLNFIVFYKK